MSTRFKDITNNSDTLTFGKYRGRMYQDLIKYDPEYLLWCHSKQIIKLEGSLYTELFSAVNVAKPRKKIKMRDYATAVDYDHDLDFGDWYDPSDYF